MLKNKVFVSFFVGILLIGLISVVFAAEDKFLYVIHQNGLYLVKVDLNKYKIRPYVSDKLETVDKIGEKTNALAAINSGFFDARSQKTVSFITENGNIIANPEDNINLTSNPKLKPHLNEIYNRSEFRLYNCKNKITASINYHNDNLKADCELISSTQAGPMLLPDMDLEKEFFILKDNGKIIRDSIGVMRKTDRSAIAIKGNYIYLIITDENSPVTINELQTKLKKLGLEQAMGFDGGGSVSLYVKQKDGIFYQDREEKGASRAVKSAIIISE